MGLSYVKMITEEHHGYVEVESELYAGSTFKVYLPLKEHGDMQKIKILLAEDDENLGHAAARISHR